MGFKKCNEITYGDLVRTRRVAGYYHYGIAASDSTIIHYSGLEGDNVLNPENIKVIETDIDGFLRGDELEVLLPFKTKQKREEIVKRARNCLGNSKFQGKYYNLASNNCEHFARYCYFGKKVSNQVGIVIGSTIMMIANPILMTGTAINLLSKGSSQYIKKKFKKK